MCFTPLSSEKPIASTSQSKLNQDNDFKETHNMTHSSIYQPLHDTGSLIIKDTKSTSSKDSINVNQSNVNAFTATNSSHNRLSPSHSNPDRSVNQENANPTPLSVPSSFKQVKVIYYDDMNYGKNIFNSNQEQKPLALPIFMFPNNERNTLPQESSNWLNTTVKPKQQLTRIIQNQNITTSQNRTCTCSKTKCMKKYCECLANGLFCHNCNCVDCHNTPNFKNSKTTTDPNIIGCTCTKSNCNKKYCECFKDGKRCGGDCRCVGCLNQEHQKNEEIVKKEKGKVYRVIDNSNGVMRYNENYFVIERVSVCIERNVCYVKKVVIKDLRGGDDVCDSLCDKEWVGNKRERDEKLNWDGDDDGHSRC